MGAAASPGVAEGPARVVRDVDQIVDVRDGEILVCTVTSPGWAPIFPKIRAVVTDIGGIMSHAAIVCREYGLPAVVGTGRATAEITTGQWIRVDGSSGVVSLLDTPRSMSAWTLNLAELTAADTNAFGGKGTNLGELIANGIPVPPGFAVSTAAFDSFMDEGDARGRVATLLDGIDTEDVAAVHEASEQVALELRRTPVPAVLRDEVGERYGALASAEGKIAPPVAVRSSARGEDSAEATFAGQQETYLWVRGVEGVCEAMRGCWISLYSPPAITYRARLGSATTLPRWASSCS